MTIFYWLSRSGDTFSLVPKSSALLDYDKKWQARPLRRLSPLQLSYCHCCADVNFCRTICAVAVTLRRARAREKMSHALRASSGDKYVAGLLPRISRLNEFLSSGNVNQPELALCQPGEMRRIESRPLCLEGPHSGDEGQNGESYSFNS